MIHRAPLPLFNLLMYKPCNSTFRRKKYCLKIYHCINIFRDAFINSLNIKIQSNTIWFCFLVLFCFVLSNYMTQMHMTSHAQYLGGCVSDVLSPSSSLPIETTLTLLSAALRDGTVTKYERTMTAVKTAQILTDIY